MNDFQKVVGIELRRLRNQRQLVQREAAKRMGMTPSVLSRKERGIMGITRDDIETFIRVLELDQDEALRLWILAGYLPEPGSIQLYPGDLRAMAEPWMRGLTYPALVFDGLRYLRVWNSPFEMLFGTNALTADAIHWVDYLCSDGFAERSAERYPEILRQQLRDFYTTTLPFAREQAFIDLLPLLKQRNGDRFSKAWEEVLADLIGVNVSPTIINVPSLLYWTDGNMSIEFLITEAMIAPMLSLRVLLPQGAGSQDGLRDKLVAATTETLYYRA